MAKVVTIELRAETKDAQRELDLITQEIREQKEITIEFEKELLKLEQQLKRTPKNALGQQRRLRTEITKVKDALKDQRIGLKELNLERSDATKAAKGFTTANKDLADQVSKNYGITGLLNQLTGGLASRYRDSYDAVTGLNKGLKGLRGALLATGIGAAVVAIGLLVKNFDKVKQVLTGVTAEQKRFLETQAQATIAANEASQSLRSLRDVVLDETASQSAREQALFKLTETATELNGVTLDQEDALKKVTEATEPYIKAVEARAKAEAFAQIIAEEEAKIIREQQKGLEEQVGTLDFIKAGFLSVGNAAQFSGKLSQTAFENQQNTINKSKTLIGELQTQYEGFITTALEFENQTDENEKKAEERNKAEKKRIKEDKEAKEQSAKDLENLINQVSIIEDENLKRAIEREQLEKNAVLDKFFTIIEAAKQNGIDTTILEEEKQAQLTEIENKYAKIRLQSEIEVEQRRINAKRQAVDAAIKLFGAETAAGKAALIAKQVLAAQELISEARKTITFSSLVAARSSAAVAEGTAQTAKVGFPQNIPMLIAYALQAAGIVSAISQAVGKSKAVATSLGGGGGSAPSISAPRTAVGSTPPAFNIVGAGGTSQLAEAIGSQTQEPVRAYVVSNDVSTAQELDRNIVKGASLG
jgi:hypothetical protein